MADLRPFLQSNRLVLRPLRAADLPLIRRWRNESRAAFVSTDEISEATHQAWFEQYRSRDDDLMFVIHETGLVQRAVGVVSLYNVDWAAGHAEFGRLTIGEPEARGRGLAREATRALVRLAGALGLLELTLVVREQNATAIHIYKTEGWKTVGARDGLIQMRRRSWERWDDPGMADAIDGVWRDSRDDHAHRRRLVASIRPYIRYDASLLEVGCGTGRMFESLVEGGLITPEAYRGVDTSDAMLALARRRHPDVRFDLGDAFALELGDASVDAVLCCEVLGHLPSIRRPIEEICRVAARAVMVTLWDHPPGEVPGFLHECYAIDHVRSLVPAPWHVKAIRLSSQVVLYAATR